ncbi:MAG TPA: hypothetical protein VGL13_01100 [Polyangiaceae bacterium]
MFDGRLSLWALRFSFFVSSSTALFLVVFAGIGISLRAPAVTRTEVLLAGFMPSESIPSARVLPAAASPVTTGAKPALTEMPPSAPSGAPLIATAIVPELTGAPMIAASIVGQGARFARQFDASVFQRGNIHAHSNESDGDADPRAVYLWYRSHGYQFAAVTDHNVFVDPERFRDLESKDFVLLGGEEVTMRAAGKPVHINALCSSQRVLGGTFDNAERALSVGVERVVAAGGIPLINHPNFYWGIDQPALLAVRGVSLLEIYSGHPSVAGEGDEHHPSHEAMWDALLSSGQDYMGVAVDDAHHLHPNSDAQSQPGRAWIEAFAPTLERSLLCKAIMEGMLYASNGAKLERIAVSESAYDVWPAAADTSVEFVGEGGHVLATSHTKIAGERVTYRPEGRESYVRVRVMDNEGKRAWTPPVRVLSQ